VLSEELAKLEIALLAEAELPGRAQRSQPFTLPFDEHGQLPHDNEGGTIRLADPCGSGFA